MTAQFQFFQSLPHKKADFVKKKPAEHGVIYAKRSRFVVLLLVNLSIKVSQTDEFLFAVVLAKALNSRAGVGCIMAQQSQ